MNSLFLENRIRHRRKVGPSNLKRRRVLSIPTFRQRRCQQRQVPLSFGDGLAKETRMVPDHPATQKLSHQHQAVLGLSYHPSTWIGFRRISLFHIKAWESTNSNCLLRLHRAVIKMYDQYFLLSLSCWRFNFSTYCTRIPDYRIIILLKRNCQFE